MQFKLITMKYHLLLTVVFCFFLGIFSLHAQEILITGKAVEIGNSSGIPSVAILDSASGIGVLTNQDGVFSLKLSSGNGVLIISHISYEQHRLTYHLNSESFLNLGDIQLQPQLINLSEVNVISSFVTDRTTPLAFSTVNSKKIEQRIANQDYPEVLKFVPGIYATREGGGSGDNRLSLRGFQQENVAVMLNGVPVSSMENGLVYWSNWAGLADATEAIQVQRGMGASRIAMNSVGGTINIITKPAETLKGGFLRFSMADYGNQKTIFSISSGKLKNNTAFTFLGSHTSGPGYVDATYVHGWSYFLSFSFQPARKHKFIFTAMGSPERHGQRNYPMSIEDYKKNGIKYNSNWGIYNGQILNLSENFYHKPQLCLNYYFLPNARLSVTTSTYLSMGYGGGRFTEAFDYGKSTWSFRKNNQIDFDAIFTNNTIHNDSTNLDDGSVVYGYSKNILTHYRANHYWVGILSTLNYEVTPNVKLISGVHIRTFQSHLYEEINDLMGGRLWVDKYDWSPAGVAGRKQIKYVGDIINVNNYSSIFYSSIFSQLEYVRGPLTAFVATTVSGSAFTREDPQNYIVDPVSKTVNRYGFDMKMGCSYKIGINAQYGNLYSNIGFFTKEPYYKFIFVTYSNTVADNILNEKIKGAELGYVYDNERINARINFYSTLWNDKSVQTYENIQLNDSTLVKSNVTGLSALHMGAEIELTYTFCSTVQMSGVASLGNWKWNSDGVAQFTSNNEVVVAQMPVYTKGLFVGDAPQTQLGISFDYHNPLGLQFAIDFLWYDRLYANFDPANRTHSEDRTQPLELPAYSMLDVMLGYNFTAKQFPVILQLNCQNLFDKEVVLRCDDGPGHDMQTFKGFWSLGRTFNVSAKLSF